MNELIEFLTKCNDEDEEEARTLLIREYQEAASTTMYVSEEEKAWGRGYLAALRSELIRAVEVFSDRPGFKDEWRVT